MTRTTLTSGDWPVSAQGRLLLALMAATGCGMTSDGPATGGVAADTVFLDPAITIGVEEGDPNYLFGRITSVAVDGEGRVYVGDRFGATVRVYDSDGAFLRQIAGEGEGPGEISYQPAFMTFDGEGRLYVRDAVGVTVFSPPPPRAGASLPDSVVATGRTIGLGDLGTEDRDRVTRDGRYLRQSSVRRPGVRPRIFYLPFADGVPTGDTLELPA